MSLTIVMYHYVRDPEGTQLPGLKALPTQAFRDQLDRLTETHDIIRLEQALETDPEGDRPRALLTFDDGLREHAEFVTEELARRGLSGVFLLPTACCADGEVLLIHKHHALMAHLGVPRYQYAFVAELVAHGAPGELTDAQRIAAEATYRWDDAPTREFKYLATYVTEPTLRREVTDTLFAETFGDETAFAREFYLSMEDARAMQSKGMIIGGHTHRHPVLSSLEHAAQRQELASCMHELKTGLAPQPLWPFAYPFGKRSTFTDDTMRLLQEVGFHCAFTTEVGSVPRDADPFQLPRVDTKDVE